MTTTINLNIPALRVELARRGMRQADLAQRCDIAATTFSSWLHGRHPAPPDLAERMEVALGVPRGTLAVREGAL